MYSLGFLKLILTVKFLMLQQDAEHYYLHIQFL